MNPMTPSGTRTFAISIPFGRRQPRTVSPTGSGQRGDLADARHHALDPRVGERQAVEEGARMALAARPLEVRAVRLEDGGGLLLEAARHGEERVALHARVGERQAPGGLARGPGARLDQLAHVDRRHGPRVSRGPRVRG